MSSIRELVREAHACGVNAFMGVPPIPVRLREINISGLRERRLHTHGYTFVKVSIDNREILKTDVSPEPTAPTWVFARPKILSIYPSSAIRFCVFRWHRHMQTEEYVGEVEGTAWAFCSESYAQTPSEDSPNLRIHPSISLDMPKEQPFPAAREEVDIVEVERHRIEVLRRQRSTRKQGGFVKGVLPGLLDVVTDDMDSLLRLLDHVAPAVPLSRIAIILLHGVQKMVKAHGQVDSDIEDLLALLREVLVHAASCEGDDIKKQAVKLVGDSASIIDGWVHSRSGKQLVKATYIQQRVKVFHAQLTEFNAMLRDMVKARPAQRLVQHSVQSVKIGDPEDLPELDRSDTISVLDSPTPQTPPATFVQFDGPRPASKGDGPLTHVVKEVETHLGEWHHVKECYGIQADGEIAVVDNVSAS